jgi:AAA+ ATPase superfamily predicted ATPase
VTLSRKKLLAEGKEPSPEIAYDLEVIEDAAIIFYAGLEAERKYCRENSIEVDESHSINDYNYVDNLIEKSNQEFKLEKNTLISISREAVIKYWEPINEIARLLRESENNTIDAVSVIETLDNGFGRNSF